MRRMWLASTAAIFAFTAWDVVSPRAGMAQGLFLTGYADFEASAQKLGSTNREFFFDAYHFNLIGVAQIMDDLFAGGEVEIEHAGEEIALEYGYLGYTGIPNLRIVAGKFIVPFGRFNKDVHPAIANKLPGRPLGLDKVLPATYSDVGVWVSGARRLADGARLGIDVFAVNGLAGKEGGEIRDMRDNDRDAITGGRDDNKALGGRLGLDLVALGLDVGASLYRGDYAHPANAGALALSLVGVDGSFQRAGLQLRAEFVQATQDLRTGELSKKGGYAQASYLVIPQVEPAVRYSVLDFPDAKNDQTRWSVGVSFYITPAAALRLAYDINLEPATFKKDNNGAVANFNVIF